jgi:deoxycytidylate deaminase
LIDKIAELGIIKGKTQSDRLENIAKVRMILDQSELSSLTEFSRAVHAEMEAILHAARNGVGSLRKATLYVTTYPCENCVKHLLAAGIKKVVYIEPYPKSRALAFYKDFIKTCTENDDCGLCFEQFSGISPTMYSKYFKMNTERKNSSGQLTQQRDKPFPLTNVYMDSFARYESGIAEELIEKEEELLNER